MGANTPSAPLPKVVVDWDETTSLGFSAAEVAEQFAGLYSATLRYVDGSETELTLRVTPTESVLTNEYGHGSDGTEPVAAVVRYIGPGEGEDALVVNVDVAIETVDGRFQERTNQNLLAASLELGWISGVATGDVQGSYRSGVPTGAERATLLEMNITLDPQRTMHGTLVDWALEEELPDGGWTDGKVGEW